MNPGKVVDPYRLDENLKLGADYNPWRPQVRFAYQQDGGDFAHAALRCVGVGKCRRPGRRRRDVPVVHGHARGEAHDARPGAAPLRDAAGRHHHRRLAERRGLRGARSLPRLQGLHERLSGQRRHADLQGRVPPPPLQGHAPLATAPRLCLRPDRPGGAGRLAHAGAVNFLTHTPPFSPRVQARRRDVAGAGRSRASHR